MHLVERIAPMMEQMVPDFFNQNDVTAGERLEIDDNFTFWFDAKNTVRHHCCELGWKLEFQLPPAVLRVFLNSDHAPQLDVDNPSQHERVAKWIEDFIHDVAYKITHTLIDL